MIKPRNPTRMWAPVLFVHVVLVLLLQTLLFFPAYAASGNDIKLDISVETNAEKPVSPREIVPFKVNVHNQLGEAWLRVNIKTTASGIDKDFSISNLKFSEDWIVRGEYCYYTKKAAQSTIHQAIESFQVPDLSLTKEGQLTIAIYAEAIDAKLVVPDFSLDDPWKGKSPDAAASYTIKSTGGGGSGGGGGTGLRAYNFSSSSTGLIRYDAPQENATLSSGSWTLADAEHSLWKFGSSSTGDYANSGWYYIRNPYAKNGESAQWFYFNNSAFLETGWVQKSADCWYHTHEISDGDLGAMDTGWYTDAQDQRFYYLDPILGTMKSGWQTIDGKSYYFASLSDIPGPTWFYSMISNTSAGRWLYNTLGLRSFGSLYINEQTPDGRYVDKSGALAS